MRTTGIRNTIADEREEKAILCQKLPDLELMNRLLEAESKLKKLA